MSAAWPTPTVVEFAKTSAGGTPKKSNAEFYDGGTIPWLLSGEVGVRDISSATNFITEAGLKGSSAKLFPPDSVLVAMYGATAGEVGILRFEAATNQAVCAILPGKSHVPEYLYYYLLLAKPLLVSQAIGNAQPNISQAKIKALEIPLPPLEEQKRIVAVLDQAFAALDRARANAEANLADAEELFDRSAAALHGEAASEAAYLPLGELADFRNGLNYSRHSSGQAVKIAGVGDFQQNFSLPTDQLKSVKIDGELDEQDRLECGDIITVRSNGNKDLIGRVMLVPANDEVMSYSGFVIRIRLLDDRLEPAFLCHYMKSEQAVAHLLAGGGGANISNLNQRILGSLKVPMISMELQKSLVGKLDELGLHVSHLRRVSLAKLEALEDLRQSILQKAFAGELT